MLKTVNPHKAVQLETLHTSLYKAAQWLISCLEMTLTACTFNLCLDEKLTVGSKCLLFDRCTDPIPRYCSQSHTKVAPKQQQHLFDQEIGSANLLVVALEVHVPLSGIQQLQGTGYSQLTSIVVHSVYLLTPASTGL